MLDLVLDPGFWAALFSVDSILTVVGMTDIYLVMAGSVVISVALMLLFAEPIAGFMRDNPDFEILGLFVLLRIGFVLFLEGGELWAWSPIDFDSFAVPSG